MRIAYLLGILLAVASTRAADPARSVIGADIVSVADVIDDDRNVALTGGKTLRLPLKKGVLVLSVSPFGPSRGKLQQFDVIDRVEREAVEDLAGFTEQISKLPAGKPVRLSIRRVQPTGGKSKTSAGFYKKDRVEVSPIAWEDLIRAAMEEERLPNSAAVRYEHREAPEFNGATGLDVFFTVDGDDAVGAYLNLRLRRADWLFVERWTIDVDGSKFEIPGESYKISREVLGPDNLSEWEVVAADAKLATLVKRLEGAERVSITFHGKDYYHAEELSDENLQRLRGEVAAAKVHGWKE